MTRTLPKLTTLELEILNHRLDVPEAIADVFDGEFARTDVEEVASLLRQGKPEEADGVAGPLVTDHVLADAVEGSTMYGGSSSESPQKQAAILRAGESLARKIGEFVGSKIEFPGY